MAVEVPIPVLIKTEMDRNVVPLMVPSQYPIHVSDCSVLMISPEDVAMKGLYFLALIVGILVTSLYGITCC